MQRYIITNESIALPNFIITGDDYYHIKTVMRMRLNDKVYLCNQERTWIAEITAITNDAILLKEVEEIIENQELPYEVCIAEGAVRKEKIEEVIDYLSELGASRYISVQMERSIVKSDASKMDKKAIRYQKIAKEATEQSHRKKVMKIDINVSWKELLKEKDNYDLCLFASVQSDENDSLKKLLKTRKYKNILFVVGPEAGISEKETKDLLENGFLPITLGPRVLRTQVAPTYIMAALSYEWEGKE